jgi:CheY-specific phosphatase CheX
MIKKLILASVISAFGLTGLVSAQTSGSGTLGMSGSVQGSILVTFTTDTGGMTVTGTGSSAGTLPFSTIQMYGGSVPGNVTKSLTSNTAFTLSTTVAVQVDIANATSDNYTLNASLNSADSNHSWKFNGTTLTTTPQAVDSSGTYGQANSYAVVLGVSASSPASALTNTINFSAVAN